MAKCQTCGGVGLERIPPDLRLLIPEYRDYEFYSNACPECGGSGLGHCCDGLREQPEPVIFPCVPE
jgi:hypothetical protein